MFSYIAELAISGDKWVVYKRRPNENPGQLVGVNLTHVQAVLISYALQVAERMTALPAPQISATDYDAALDKVIIGPAAPFEPVADQDKPRTLKGTTRKEQAAVLAAIQDAERTGKGFLMFKDGEFSHLASVEAERFGPVPGMPVFEPINHCPGCGEPEGQPHKPKYPSAHAICFPETSFYRGQQQAKERDVWTCPACGSGNWKEKDYCNRCGENKPGKPKDECASADELLNVITMLTPDSPAPIDALIELSKAKLAKLCTACNAVNLSEATYCGWCGVDF